MQRIIKFRAWKGTSMYEPDYIDGSTGQEFESWGTEGVERVKSVVMQFTGLKDKNGVEIYEGDILGKGEIPRGIVSFSGGAFRGHYFYVPTSGGWEYSDEWEDDIRSTDDVVIGNIHESPELLTK